MGRTEHSLNPHGKLQRVTADPQSNARNDHLARTELVSAKTLSHILVKKHANRQTNTSGVATARGLLGPTDQTHHRLDRKTLLDSRPPINS